MAGVRWDGPGLSELGAALKAAPADVRKRINKAMNDSAIPAREAGKAAALKALPSSGGLAATVSKGMRVQVARRLTGSRPSITLRASHKGITLGPLNAGKLRHPVFGNRAVWVGQAVRPGWWDRAMQDEGEATARRLREAVDAAVDAIVDEL